MSNNNNLFAEGMPRGIAKVAWLAGVVMVLIAAAIYIRFVSANHSSMFDKVPAVITAITIPGADSTLRKAVYEYQVGQEVRRESMTYPAAESKKYVVGGKFMLLRDRETGEVIFADSGDAVGTFSLKLGFVGLVILIAAIVFLRRNPVAK
jgi:hypothetical protein